MQHRQTYELGDIHVAVVTREQSIRETAWLALDEKGFQPSQRPANITFDLTGNAPSPNGSGTLLTDAGGTLTIRHDRQQYHIEHGTAGLTVCIESRRATAYLVPASGTMDNEERVDLMTTIALSLYTLLRPLGYFGLHAVGLVADGRGFVFSGESDSGKSTTALALVRQGWHYLSDDSLLLRLDDDGVEAIGLRRHFCLDPAAAAFFPELAEHSWPPQVSDPEKWKVDVEALHPGRSVGTARPSVLLFPRVEAVAQSRIEPVSRRDAFDLLAGQSAFKPYIRDPLAANHFAVLAALLRQCSVHRLILGRDAIENPGTFARMLERIE